MAVAFETRIDHDCVRKHLQQLLASNAAIHSLSLQDPPARITVELLITRDDYYALMNDCFTPKTFEGEIIGDDRSLVSGHNLITDAKESA